MHVVIDTNVLLVANGSHKDASNKCRAVCVERLLEQQKTGVTVIDDSFLILGEYLNKTRPNKQKGVGDVFLKWLLQNEGNQLKVHRVHITELAADEFAEFPDQGLQPFFDPPDRKFVAVANSHPDKPSVWQAVDCKWMNWWSQLADRGVKVEFLCPEDVCRFFARKYPGIPQPALPET